MKKTYGSKKNLGNKRNVGTLDDSDEEINRDSGLGSSSSFKSASTASSWTSSKHSGVGTTIRRHEHGSKDTKDAEKDATKSQKSQNNKDPFAMEFDSEDETNADTRSTRRNGKKRVMNDPAEPPPMTSSPSGKLNMGKLGIAADSPGTTVSSTSSSGSPPKRRMLNKSKSTAHITPNLSKLFSSSSSSSSSTPSSETSVNGSKKSTVRCASDNSSSSTSSKSSSPVKATNNGTSKIARMKGSSGTSNVKVQSGHFVNSTVSTRSIAEAKKLPSAVRSNISSSVSLPSKMSPSKNFKSKTTEIPADPFDFDTIMDIDQALPKKPTSTQPQSGNSTSSMSRVPKSTSLPVFSQTSKPEQHDITATYEPSSSTRPVVKRTFGRNKSVASTSTSAQPTISSNSPFDQEMNPMSPPGRPTSRNRASKTTVSQHTVSVTYGGGYKSCVDTAWGQKWEGRDEGLSSDEDEDEKVTTMHELKESGGMKRFSDEMDYLLDGLKSENVNIRRSSTIDLARKFLSGTFALTVRAHNYVSRIYTLLSSSTDTIILACLSFILLVLSQDKRNVDLLLEDISVLTHMNNFLSMKDPFLGVENVKEGGFMAKNKEKRLLKEVKEVVQQSSVVKNADIDVTIQNLSALTLCYLVLAKPRNEEGLRDAFKNSGVLQEMARFLVKCHSTNKEASFMIEKCLAFLEFSSLYHAENGVVIGNVEGVMDCLLDLIESMRDHPPIVLSVLRVLINLTNDNPPLCDVLISHISILLDTIQWTQSLCLSRRNSEEAEIDQVSFDGLLLSIGLLINLIQVVPRCSDAVRESRIEVDGEKKEGLDVLVDMFVHFAPPSLLKPSKTKKPETQEEEEASTETSVLLSYISALLGCLVKNNQANRTHVISKLPNHSFKPLIQVLEEFINFQKQLLNDTGMVQDDTARSRVTEMLDHFAEVVGVLRG